MFRFLSLLTTVAPIFSVLRRFRMFFFSEGMNRSLVRERDCRERIPLSVFTNRPRNWAFCSIVKLLSSFEKVGFSGSNSGS